ncbi:hypothetical protein D3C77_254470 [compost metagenome]
MRISAPLALYNTELELTEPIAIEKKGTASLPTAVVAGTVSADNQGQLIQLKDVTISNLVAAAPSGSFEFDATSTDGIVTHVRVDGRTGLTENTFTYVEGDKIDITGVAAIYRGIYQLKPRGAGDVIAASTVETPVEQPEEVHATSRPDVAVLSSDHGYITGLRGSEYNVIMNLWWGNNGSSYKLYEDGVMIKEGKLVDASPQAQHIAIPIIGKGNGEYTYELELINKFGTTKSQALTVHVTDANPGVGVLSSNNWDYDGSYNVTMNMWWGTNATSFELYENGTLVDTQNLNAGSPQGQQAMVQFEGKLAGVYEYYAVLKNAVGQTSTQTIRVEVRQALKAA